jgi:hypothetical protein
MSQPSRLLIFACWAQGFATAAPAQWSVTNLHTAGLPPAPPGVCSGQAHTAAYGTSAQQQVGFRYYYCGGLFGAEAACLWNGSAKTWVDLHPKFAEGGASAAYATSGINQVGLVMTELFQHASMWSGTAESWIDLGPPQAIYSVATDLSDTHQVGVAIVGGRQRASLWSGTSASWVDLHPSDATSSEAMGIAGTQQVGYAYIDDQQHASLWNGTSESWVDLHPDGAVSSIARAAAENQQVGSATFGTVTRASLWHGSAASRVDLHPEGSTGSLLTDTTGTQQVGQTISGGLSRATLWYGTPESRVDLGAMLPAGFSHHTHAKGISSNGSVTRVSGYATNLITSRTEALLWTIPARLCQPNIVNSPDSVFQVDVDDLIAVILQWGPCRGCPEDINDDGQVDVDDLIGVILAWGPCP